MKIWQWQEDPVESDGLLCSLAKDGFYIIINFNSNSAEAESTLLWYVKTGQWWDHQFDVASQAQQKDLGDWQGQEYRQLYPGTVNMQYQER